MDYEGRVSRLQQRLRQDELDGLLVTNLTNVRYLSGFSGTNGQLLLTGERAIFLSDSRYRARAESLVQGAEVSIYRSKLEEGLRPLLSDGKTRLLGVEGATMTLAQQRDLGDAFPSTEMVTTTDLVEDLRRGKDEDELAVLEQAVALGDRAFAWLLERLSPGQTEREIALDLEVTMRRWGAEGVSFPPIVGSGELSAHIHHTASDRELKKGDLVLLDFGCRVDGYCSDLTRTVVLGPASEEQLQRYDLVLRAQKASIDRVRAGISGQDADASARGIIQQAGLGDDFGHGLGHGVGLDIHEAPRLSWDSQHMLRSGDVVTVEPGVYRAGVGGIRIEDCVWVGDEAARVLGSAPKDELIEL